MTALLVALAGSVGALARYGIGVSVGSRTFPWTTLGINLVGSFLLGALIHAGQERGWSDKAVIPVGTGFLGAFTTFSTFSVETQTMLRDGRTGAAGAYVGISVVGGVALATLGYSLTA